MSEPLPKVLQLTITEPIAILLGAALGLATATIADKDRDRKVAYSVDQLFKTHRLVTSMAGGIDQMNAFQKMFAHQVEALWGYSSVSHVPPNYTGNPVLDLLVQALGADLTVLHPGHTSLEIQALCEEQGHCVHYEIAEEGSGITCCACGKVR